MVEKGDAPLRPGIVEDRVEPFDLLGVARMVAVERGEARVAFVERVAIAVGHVERLEMDLEIAIVVADGRVELDAAIEQRLVGRQEISRSGEHTSGIQSPYLT